MLSVNKQGEVKKAKILLKDNRKLFLKLTLDELILFFLKWILKTINIFKYLCIYTSIHIINLNIKSIKINWSKN